MKVYIHYEDESDKKWTYIYKDVPDNLTVKDLIEDFIKRFKDKFGETLESDNLSLVTLNNTIIDKNKKISRKFENLADLFITNLNSKKSTPEIKTSTIEIKKPIPEIKKPVIDTKLLNTCIENGEDYEKESKYRQAVEQYDKALKISSKDKISLLKMMKLWLKVKRPKESLKYTETALSTYSDDIEILLIASKIKHECEYYQDAMDILNKALKISENTNKHPEIKLDDIKIAAAKTMYAIGGVFINTAIKMVMEVVEPEHSHFEGLLLYSKISFDRGLYADAVKVLLRLIVQKQDHEIVKKYLAESLEHDSGMDALISELVDGKGVASAYAFLGNKIKDYGAVNPALTLYKKALELEPSNPSFALNYIHTLELNLKYNEIFEFAVKFLKNSEKILNEYLDYSEIIQNIKNIPIYDDNDIFVWCNFEPWNLQKPLDTDVEEIEKPIKKVKYDLKQLDTLAFIFTLVKVLYIGGAINRIDKIVEEINYARKCSKEELHTTMIRNETAYFSCIRQILREQPPEPKSIGSNSSSNQENINLKPIYLCGDSHCLSAAWRNITLKNEDYVIVPKLVTGCKIWHLREESKFYPKVSFENVTKSIPKGSKIIMLFGEIDCREGIMLAVQKCKYDNDLEAIKTTVKIYLTELKKLISNNKFEIFVHPVPPVLDVTRPIVKPFVKCLKLEIEALSQRQLYKGKLHWLDFFDELLSDNKMQLKSELKFDDTHLSPVYVKYLNDALAQF